MEAEALVLADRQGIIRYGSSGATTLFGYSVNEAIGQSLDLIVPAEHREAHWKGFRRAFESRAAAAETQSGPFHMKEEG